MLTEITKDNIDDVVSKNEMVLLDFWAQWCGPCKAFEPIYEEVSKKYPDIIFGKIDTQKETELAMDFQIRSIPTIMIIRQGIAVFSQSGTLPASALETRINDAKKLDMEEVKKKIAAAGQ